MKAPTKAPTRLPTPPRITTIRASGSMSESRPGYADMIGPPTTPAAPPRPAPRQNTGVTSPDAEDHREQGERPHLGRAARVPRHDRAADPAASAGERRAEAEHGGEDPRR